MLNVLPSIVVLGLAALAALVLVLNRWSPPEKVSERRTASQVLALAVGIQGVHFVEETATGLHVRLGELIGLPSIPLSLFVAFNVAWLAIWIVSVPGLRSAHAAAFFAAWFLAIAGMFNGIAHPLLAMAAGGYFPGLVSSLFIGVAGAWLCLRLLRATRPTGPLAGR